MSSALPFLHLARVTIVCRSPLSIGSHIRDPRYDTPIVRDANGLPAIPGSTLAGSLRHRREREHGEDREQRLFGWTTNDFEKLARADQRVQARARTQWQASRVQLSWAHLHDADDRPVDGLLIEEADENRLEQDPILRRALESSPMTRDHVSLNERGTAVHRHKLDRSCLPPGYRFSFELRLLSAMHEDPAWEELRALVASPGWRLGGATRRGYGRIEVVRFLETCFDLSDPENYLRFTRLSPKLSDPLPEGVLRPWRPVGALDTPKATLKLTADDFIRFGQGERSLGEPGERAPDLLQLTTERVVWRAVAHGREQGKLESEPCAALLPASAIKGALRHRCLFHLRRGRRAFAGKDDPEVCAMLKSLFGAVNDDDRGQASGQAGLLLIDDALVEVQSGAHAAVTHNSIDRFSGGVRRGALYSEEMLYRPSFEIELRIDRESRIEESHRAPLQSALLQAVRDLCTGRLALGAGSSRGHGCCTGTVVAEDPVARAWFGGEDDARGDT